MPSQPTLTGDATDPTGTTGGTSGPRGVSSRDRDRPARGPVRPGTLVKIAVMAVVNALGVFGVLAAWREGHMGILAAMVALVVAADWVYFSRRTLPLKYILPGLAFLLVFQVYVVAYTGWVAFTNYGDGHNSTKEQAVEALLLQNERRVEGSATYPLTVVERGGALGFAIVEDGEAMVGTADDPLSEVPDATVDDDRVTEVPGATVLSRQEILRRQSEVTSLRVPVSDDPNDGWVRTQDARTGFLATPSLEWDPEADTMTDVATGTVYRATSDGSFRSDDGQRLNVGWRVMVGIDNFRTAFGDERYAQPFVKILVWTFAFAILSVVTTFLLGLFLAITFNDTRVRGRKVYRTLLIFPYAIPGFLAALLWSGMLNRSYGFINQVLLGGAAVPWLTDPWLAKLSVLGVNLWLGFPYMFLICTGALQSLPGDVLEAAKVDGASAWRTWRSVTLPLLLVATSPLLISSFAFNFNNFTLIYMLTGGGPRFADASVPLGHTDILISMVYSVSGLDGTAAKNYGLASALSIVIFVIVATISAITFKRTKQFEEIS
ncbi:MAG: ABC transporter permease subunit [Cellulomonas sp.]|jgi:arabinogalactan oligomer / maltooligosaccharide transport system permease protein|uniref:ABC transporter permease subunit n=1 Tax=Cellulomonas sp. TaxID=40001 RepID=UPI0019D99030|nr:ABC transporter permease subunit [Cellulomonas sp.]MBF0686932.1 ABC transporter permease subunit [Cellulomonas sp.]